MNDIKQQLEIQKMYVKNSSLETYSTPQIFHKGALDENWNPEVKIDLDVKNTKLDENIYEVTLLITVTAKDTNNKENKIFQIKVEQAGLFLISGYEDKSKKYVLNAYCPNLLFPYVSEGISTMALRAGFPQLNLIPVNFEALYTEEK
jgi:preprotein translocase subunit SecB